MRRRPPEKEAGAAGARSSRAPIIRPEVSIRHEGETTVISLTQGDPLATTVVVMEATSAIWKAT
jgi:hypothetical protein